MWQIRICRDDAMKEKIRIGDVCTVVSGSTPKTNVLEYWDGDIDWITPAELDENTLVVNESARKITRLAVEKTGLKPLPKGTVILSSRAPIGKVAIAGKEMFCNQGFKNIICSQSIYNEYLYWFLKGNTEYLNSLGRGVTFKEISKGIVEDIRIALPSVDEQRYIADILKVCWETKIKQNRLLEYLNILVKSRFIEMFGEPENNNKAWPVKPLDKLCAVGSSKRVYQSEQGFEGVPFWRISDLVSKIDTGTVDSTLFISEIKYTELKRSGLVPVTGDILVTSRGTLGRCYIIKDEDRFYFQDGMISWLSNYSEEITPLYLQYLFTMSGFRKQIDNMQAGSTVAYLSIAMLKKLQVMVPDKALQDHFAAFVTQIDKSEFEVSRWTI